jgi:hypothetical protein
MTSNGAWTFEGLTGDGWAIIGPDDEERHGDWLASGYGRAIALDRDDAIRIVNALNSQEPTKVYVLTHTEYEYEWIETIIRGISLDEQKLKDSIIIYDSSEPIPDRRYKSGYRNPVTIHDQTCCTVDKYELEEIDGDTEMGSSR